MSKYSFLKKSSCYKKYPISIWFLDEDPLKSSQFQTNNSLIKSIDGCYNSLISARFYYIGIRNKRFYNYYFNSENKENTMMKYFDEWPLHNKPSFMSYTTKLSRWCRMCYEHYKYIFDFLGCLLLEYEFRFKKRHGLQKFYEWEQNNFLNIPKANISKIDFPWKILNPKYRRKNIIDGFRLQLMNSFDDNDPFKAYNGTSRDIPEFIKQYFNFNLQNFD